MLKPVGVLVFDDHGVQDWQKVEQFVDKHVRKLNEWLFVGSDWRTAVFTRRPKAD